MCSTLRLAGAIVHDEARGEGACYSASAVWAVASLHAGSASADSEHRRHIRRHKERAKGWGARRGVGVAVRRRAECTSLSPASYAASFPQYSAYCFGVRLHARGCCGFGRLCGAAQRYLVQFWTAPSAPRSSSSAMALVLP